VAVPSRSAWPCHPAQGVLDSPQHWRTTCCGAKGLQSTPPLY